jgi:Aldehyde dehydrogenase family
VNLAVSKIGPALMAGNAVVIKPPTQGAVSAIQMVQVRPQRCNITRTGPHWTEGFVSVFMMEVLCAAVESSRQQA